MHSPPAYLAKNLLAMLLFIAASICTAQAHGFFQQIWQEDDYPQSSVATIFRI
jgi:hypothetical protein